MASHTPEDIAQAIAPQFKETTLDTITTIISRYYEAGYMEKDLIFRQESFDLLQDILEEAGELKGTRTLQGSRNYYLCRKGSKSKQRYPENQLILYSDIYKTGNFSCLWV